MNAKPFDKSRPPCRYIAVGSERVSRRSEAIDDAGGAFDVKLTEGKLAVRRANWQLRELAHTSGVLWKYAQTARPARNGSVTRPGGADEKQCYADI